MTTEEKHRVSDLRSIGLGYAAIAKEMGISINTVKSFCRRSGSATAVSSNCGGACECCGKPIEQSSARKHKRFCSDTCRMKWWNSHTGEMKENAVCHYCRKSFHGRRGRKYCSHACYIAERFGDGHDS